MNATSGTLGTGKLSGRTLDEGARRGLPVPNVPDLSAFNMSGDLRMSGENLATLHQAGIETREIMQKYKAAMREMKVRLEILDQDLNLKKHRTPSTTLSRASSLRQASTRRLADTVTSRRWRTWSVTSSI